MTAVVSFLQDAPIVDDDGGESSAGATCGLHPATISEPWPEIAGG
jgi:hypothetical protein